jgi:hypothetical protein
VYCSRSARGKRNANCLTRSVRSTVAGHPQGQSVFQSGDSVGAAVVLPPPGNAGNSGVAVQLPPQHRRKLIGPADIPSAISIKSAHIGTIGKNRISGRKEHRGLLPFTQALNLNEHFRNSVAPRERSRAECEPLSQHCLFQAAVAHGRSSELIVACGSLSQHCLFQAVTHGMGERSF